MSYRKTRLEKGDKLLIFVRIAASLIITFFIFGSITLRQYIPGERIGDFAYYGQYNVINVHKKLPKLSEVTGSNKGIDMSKPNLFVMYKIGCPLCDSAHEGVKGYVDRYKKEGFNVYYVEATSELGKYLVDEFDLQHAYEIIVSLGVKDYYKYSQVKVDLKGKAVKGFDEFEVRNAFMKLEELTSKYQKGETNNVVVDPNI